MRRIANEILGVKGLMMKLSCRVRSLETELLSCGCFYRNCTFSSCLLFLLKLIRKKSRQGQCTMILSGTGHYLLLGEEEGGGEWVVCRRVPDFPKRLCNIFMFPPLQSPLKILLATTDPPSVPPWNHVIPGNPPNTPYPTPLSNE